jgi:dihydrolipoamide dehydrogenase
VVVVGAGPAGVMAALRAAELGAATTLVTRGHFGGMAATDGPIPVRTLAHAARLRRLVPQLARYGIAVGEPRFDFDALLERTRAVVREAAAHATGRADVERLGITLHESAGTVRFLDSRTLVTDTGLRLEADRVLLCTGGVARRLDVPGGELTATHSDAWTLTAVPESLIVIGGGMTGLQVASIFHAFGTRVDLFQRGPRILPDDDDEVAAAVASSLRASGMAVHEGFGTLKGFEPDPGGIRMNWVKDGERHSLTAALAVRAVGWTVEAGALDLPAAGVRLDARGFVAVDDHLATSVPHIYAAGDVTGRSVLVPPAVLDGHVAATNAVLGNRLVSEHGLVPMGGFTEPEYARVGLTEAAARSSHDVAVGLIGFDETTRTIIDGRTDGFVKMIADRATGHLLGCHVVGDRAADIVQAAAIAMAGGIGVRELARMPLAFPTYVGVLSRAAYRAARAIDPDFTSPVPGSMAGGAPDSFDIS